LLYRQLVKGEAIQTVPYQLGLYGRDLTADAFNIGADVLAEFRRSKLGGTASLAKHVAGFRRLLLGREVHDAFSWSDLKPALDEYGRIGSVLGRRVLSSLAFVRQIQAHAIESRLSSALSAVPAARPLGILFVCKGNICRSPFAEHYLRRKLAGRNGVYVASSGTMANTGRPSPDDAISMAHELDVDLTQHRSSHVSQAFDRPIDVVFVFDQTNLDDLAGSGVLSAETLVVPLGYLLSGRHRGIPIADPYGRGKQYYTQTYESISAAVDRFHDLLSKLNR
jgi:protein-tyrosine-phosphatase